MMAPDPAWKNPRLSGRVLELDGVRGLAILLVLLWHYVFVAAHATPHSLLSYALAPLGLAWSGVDLFFVLSGFLIGGILIDARDKDKYYQTFYARRFYRIVPLYYLWILTFLIGLHFASVSQERQIHAVFNQDIPTWSYPLFLQNFFMAYRGFGPTWMAVTWSLAIEEQFYLLLPILVRNLSYWMMTIIAAGAVVCAPLVRIGLWLAGAEPPGPHTLMASRVDALGLGVLVAFVCRNERAWHWLASHRSLLVRSFLLLGGGVALLTIYQRGIFVLGTTWLAAFYACLLLMAVVNPGRAMSAVFRNNALTRLGTISYAVYIIHQGVNALLQNALLGSEPALDGWASIIATMLSLLAVFILATLSWRFFEKPLIHRAHARYQYGILGPPSAR